MPVVRNIQVKLDVPESRHDDVDETFEQFREAAQIVSDCGWSDDPYALEDRKNQLHDATYKQVREQTDLQSSLVQSARNLAADALSNCEDRLFNGDDTSKPEFRGSVVVYNGRTITYNDDHVTLATVNGRVRAEYVLPYENEGTPFEQYWTDAWRKKEATLHKRNGEYYLHVAVEQVGDDADSLDEQTENGVVLGVDLNVDGYIAVTSTGAFLGNADYLTHERNEYERRRGNLQRVGTRSAHLTIKSIGDRFAHWSEECLHRVSNAIVHEAREHDCTHIAFEHLDGIRERISNASKFQQWAFDKVQELTEYKAETHGIGFETVNPAYTSQRCSHGECGFTHRKNRDGDEFVCLKCEKELHADYNAARNVAWKLVQNRLKSGAGRATSQLALKSGTVNANGEFVPAATG